LDTQTSLRTQPAGSAFDIAPTRIKSVLRFLRFAVRNYPLLAYVKYIRRAPVRPGVVTIVTATYNRPDLLRQAIESVRAQTYPHWEQIVVSDGPDPRVDDVVASYGDPRLRSVHTARLAVMGNYQRNYALRYATGEFVLYLDDDNVIYPDCLRVMVNGFTSDDVGYVVSPIRYGEGEMRPAPGFTHEEVDLLNYMVRRRLVERVWGQNVRYAADYFLIRAIARVSQGVFLDEVIGHHR
jgi:glycosyltransferase involved in cell wall biosynthesis